VQIHLRAKSSEVGIRRAGAERAKVKHSQSEKGGKARWRLLSAFAFCPALRLGYDWYSHSPSCANSSNVFILPSKLTASVITKLSTAPPSLSLQGRPHQILGSRCLWDGELDVLFLPQSFFSSEHYGAGHKGGSWRIISAIHRVARILGEANFPVRKIRALFRVRRFSRTAVSRLQSRKPRPWQFSWTVYSFSSCRVSPWMSFIKRSLRCAAVQS